MATPAKPATAPVAKAAPAKRAPAKRAGRKLEAGLPENHTPSEAVAFAISSQYGDLAPSVNRIMASGLGEKGRMHAITLFRDSLGVPGDPNRHPLVAIEAGTLVDGDDDAPAE